MPFNGSGTFNRIYSWVTDAANGLNVSSTRTDTDTNDIAAGLSNCITKDGQQTVTANIPFAGFKLTGVGYGTANSDAAIIENCNALHTCEFRLSLATGVPVTTSDVTGATTLYFTPYQGNKIALYDGSKWVMRSSAEISKSNAGVGGALPTDVFVYDNSGTLTMEYVLWTNDTTRATALTTQDGVLVKSGAPTRRYVGTFRSTAGGAFSDSYATRWLWNYYNRVPRPMRCATETTDTWVYSTATYRQANANTANQLDFVIGWAEDLVEANVTGAAKSDAGAPAAQAVSIGLDSTTTPATGVLMSYGYTNVINIFMPMQAQLKTIPAVGRHFLSWLEIGAGSGNTTWAGDGGIPASVQSGIHGWVRG